MKDFMLLLPEFFLLVTLAGVILGEVGYRGEKVRLISATALVGLGGAFIQTLLTYRYGPSEAFNRALSIDGPALFFKLFAIMVAGAAVGTSMHSKEIAQEKRAEYCALIIASALALCIAASATDIVIAFLSLQMLNVLGYFLAAHGQRSILSAEAAVKHLIFGGVSGALFLYGGAILFGYTHQLNIYEMHHILMANPMSHSTGSVVFILLFLSFCFQMAAFPMYLWAPDVLDGAPTPASAFLSLSSRAAGFAVALRFLIVVFAQPALSQGEWQVIGGLNWTGLVAVVAGVTMLFGALLALRQKGAKRMVAALVVGQSGFLLMGLLVLDEIGIAALLYNLLVELFALMGAFFVISVMVDELRSDRLVDLRGMLGRAVPESIGLILFLACLVGLPPLPGFVGKFTLIGAAVRHGWFFLAGVAVISSAIGAVAIARLAYSLVGDFRHPKPLELTHQVYRLASLTALFIPIVLLAIFAENVLHWAGQSLRLALW